MDYVVCKTLPEAEQITKCSLCLLCEFADKCDKELNAPSGYRVGFIVMPDDFFAQESDKAIIYGEACFVSEDKKDIIVLDKKYFCRVCKPFSVNLNGVEHTHISLNIPIITPIATINQNYVYWE